MNILLWALQILLGLYNVLGGIYTVFNYDKLKGPWATNLPAPVWVILCVLQILFGLGLIVPGATGFMPQLTPLSAACLAVNALLGCALFAQYAGFPGMLWAIVPAALLAFVAFGRFVLLPL